MRADHLQIQRGIEFYDYQELISDRILHALCRNLNVETEEDVMNLPLLELAIEISRQAGKTEAVVGTVEFAMTFVSELYNTPIHVGIFAPQIEQARTDFERLKNALRPIKDLIISDDEERKNVKERENAKTLVLPNGSSCWIAPVTTTSKPESKTFHIMLFEEAQDMNDKIVLEQIFPIGSTTNAPRIMIGTAGTKICYYLRLGQKAGAIKVYYDDVVKSRRRTYERTGDVRHLIYERTVQSDIEKHGLESDEIQRPYFGKWLLGSGQFTTEEELTSLIEDRKPTYRDTSNPSFAGIDTAKYPDSTVVTIVRFINKKKELINWMELKGDNYMDQVETIREFLKNYQVMAVAIDSTGQGDWVGDWFEQNTIWTSEQSGLYRVKFSAVSKDNMYKNLKVSIKQSLTTLPNLSTKLGERFLAQMLDLQQEYKGQLLSVAHPDDPNAHDDYPDSWALAEWAFAKYYENQGGVSFIDMNEQKRSPKHDAKGTVIFDWPDYNDW